MIRGDSGKFALEATLVLPLVLVITFACVFITSGMARQAGLYANAAQAGARAAFNWDNSYKAATTGAFYPGRYDDLYWRLTQDFDNSGLARRKIAKAVDGISGGSKTSGSYANRLLLRKVTIEANALQNVPGYMTDVYAGGALSAAMETVVTEPAETLRMLDLAKTYWPVIREKFSAEETDEMVEQFRKRPDLDDPAPLSFNDHKDAVAYMQKMVNGDRTRIFTEFVGSFREVEALDRHQIGHHAFLGYKDIDSPKIVVQYLKDEELMQHGKVKGSVWHFFRREKDGSIGPSDELRKELEKRGIVIIIHE